MQIYQNIVNRISIVIDYNSVGVNVLRIFILFFVVHLLFCVIVTEFYRSVDKIHCDNNVLNKRMETTVLVVFYFTCILLPHPIPCQK